MSYRGWAEAFLCEWVWERDLLNLRRGVLDSRSWHVLAFQRNSAEPENLDDPIHRPTCVPRQHDQALPNGSGFSPERCLGASLVHRLRQWREASPGSCRFEDCDRRFRLPGAAKARMSGPKPCHKATKILVREGFVYESDPLVQHWALGVHKRLGGRWQGRRLCKEHLTTVYVWHREDRWQRARI